MTLGIVQARLGSSRLPGKMLRPLAGRPALEHTLERARAARAIDRLVVATTDLPLDDPLARLAESLGVEVFRGHPEDVLDRYYQAAKELGASLRETIVRLTGDCPLHDPAVIDQVIAAYEQARRAAAPPVEYASNISPPTFPSGLDVEVFSFSALETAWREARRDYEREHVTPYIRDHPQQFPSLNVTCPDGDLSGLRWTLDVEADVAVLDSLLSLGRAHDEAAFSYRGGLRVIERHSSLAAANAAVGRNTPAVEAIVADALGEPAQKPLGKSREMRRRAIEVLAAPLPEGPLGAAGAIAARSSGCRIWDLDGNEYTDFVMANGTVAFGYGVSSLSPAGTSPAGGLGGQVALASRLIERLPAAGRAAFYGSLADALAAAASGAVRKTRRRRVSIFDAPLLGAEIRRGEGMKRAWRDDCLVEFTSQATNGGAPPVGTVAESAAVVVEPTAEYACVARAPLPLAELCAEMGTLLIVNSTPSLLGGYRLDLSDAPPDLEIAVLIGSGLSNGLGLAALLGAPGIFEAGSRAESERPACPREMAIAAARENLERLDNAPERERVCAMAAKLWHGLETVATDFRLLGYCELVYRPPHLVFQFCDKGPFRGSSMQFVFDDLMRARGLVWGPVLTLTHVHGDEEIEQAVEAAREAGRVLRTLIDNRAVERVFESERKRLGAAECASGIGEGSWDEPDDRQSRPVGIPA